jgi:hypothetical protein
MLSCESLDVDFQVTGVNALAQSKTFIPKKEICGADGNAFVLQAIT